MRATLARQEDCAQCAERSDAPLGSVGDSYDNALAETVIGLYKTKLIERRRPWKGKDDVEFPTLQWVDWHNDKRLLEPMGYVPPAEAEAAFYAQIETNRMAA